MRAADPFRLRFEVFGQEPDHIVDRVNGEARRSLKELLQSEPTRGGRVVLLKAPRAGYGKTLLLQSVATELAESHHFSRVGLFGGRGIDSSHLLECLLLSLCEAVDGPDGLTKLDIVARRVLAQGLEPLVQSGEVPSQDRDVALNALRSKPIETFDFHNDGAVTAHWTRANIEILGPRLASELALQCGATLRESAYWVELLFRYATTVPDNADRGRLLFETVFGSEANKVCPSGVAERLLGLGSMISIVRKLVFIIDDTEGLSTHPQHALELASFVTSFAQACPEVSVLLSLNEDVWETAFAPRLPGGLEDRLTENEINLSTLSQEEAEELVRSRAGKDGDKVLEAMSWGEGPHYARQVLKSASKAWGSMRVGGVTSASGAAQMTKAPGADPKKVAEAAAKKTAEIAAKRETEATAKRGADAAAKRAAEISAKQAAEATAKKAAEIVAKQAAEATAKKAAEVAAKQVAEAAAKKAAENAAKQAADAASKKAAEAAAKKAAEISAKQAAEAAAKRAAEVAAKQAAEAAAKRAAEVAAKQAAEAAAKRAAEIAAKQAAEAAAKKDADAAAKKDAEATAQKEAKLAAKSEGKASSGADASGTGVSAAETDSLLARIQAVFGIGEDQKGAVVQSVAKDAAKVAKEPAAKEEKPAPVLFDPPKLNAEVRDSLPAPFAPSGPVLYSGPSKSAAPAPVESKSASPFEKTDSAPSSPFAAMTPPPMEPLVPKAATPPAEKKEEETPAKAYNNPFEAEEEEEPPPLRKELATPPSKPEISPFAPADPKKFEVPAASPFSPATDEAGSSVSPFKPVEPTPVKSEARKEEPVEAPKSFSSPFSPAAKPGDPAVERPVASPPANGLPESGKPAQLPPKRADLAAIASAGARVSPFEPADPPSYPVQEEPSSPFKPAAAQAPAAAPATSSPFRAAHPAPASAEPVGAAKVSGETKPEDEISDSNAAKVDQLLKQFKERYGRE